ncbi:hypothetical protein R8Z50_22255 [Longispora sp. K20-0274]|uniref:hypothetical protein n=1 Tax=Longispora sp. K20-0274 TaxID=3088255 RepID=UPI00399C3350
MAAALPSREQGLALDKRAALAAVLRSSPFGDKVGTASGERGPASSAWPSSALLAEVVPGGLRRGQVVSVPGSAQLLLELVGGASAAGAWCALVGQPALARAGRAAAACGVVLERWLLVPEPGPHWAESVAALIGAVDVVVAAPTGPVPAALVGRLAARARQHGTVLIAFGTTWPGSDLEIRAEGSRWRGVADGRGELAGREQDVVAVTKGSRPRHMVIGSANPPSQGRGGLRLVGS